MKIIVYLNEETNIEQLLRNSISEVVATPKAISRFGKMTLDECREWAIKLSAHDIKTSLDWDTIMTEERFIHATRLLAASDLSAFSSIRTKDAGAYEWALNELNLPVALNLENGNHNWPGLQKWIARGGDRLERLILSLEIPRLKLAEYIAGIKEISNVKVEIMGLGPILLFTTPRKLLSKPLRDEGVFAGDINDFKQATGLSSEDDLIAYATSEESPHRGFRLVENQNGTYMFHPKDISLIEVSKELGEMGLDYFRVDSRWERENHLDTVVKAINESNKELISPVWSIPTIRGYSDVNRSDRLFKKLKNQETLRNDDHFVGEVLDVIKGELIGVRIKRENYTLNCGDHLKIKTPEGKEKNLLVTFIKSPELNDIQNAKTGDLVYLPYVSGLSVRSMLMLS